MKLLILDTSTGVFSAAISDGASLLGEVSGPAGPNTAARLAPAVQSLFAGSGLTPADLDGCAVTIGPGSFTGLRVGMAIIKGLAFAVNKPVVGLSSLALLAMNARESGLPVCPLFDARKGEVYGGLYDFSADMKALVPDTVSPPEQFLAGIDGPAVFLGDGSVRYRELISGRFGSCALFVDPLLDNPAASAGIPLALQAFADGKAIPPVALMPRYLRLSEAELNRTC
jgi:tRNA threonylcarbamoyladenosine biosynthesis protein TsaB